MGHAGAGLGFGECGQFAEGFFDVVLDDLGLAGGHGASVGRELGKVQGELEEFRGEGLAFKVL